MMPAMRSFPWVNLLIALLALGTPLSIATLGDRAVQRHGRGAARQSLRAVLEAEAASLGSWRAEHLRMVEQLASRGEVREPIEWLAKLHAAPPPVAPASAPPAPPPEPHPDGPPDEPHPGEPHPGEPHPGEHRPNRAAEHAAALTAGRVRLGRALAPRVDDREVEGFLLVAPDGTCLASSDPEAVGRPADFGHAFDAEHSPIQPGGWDAEGPTLARMWASTRGNGGGIEHLWLAAPVRPPLRNALDPEANEPVSPPAVALLVLRLDPRVRLHPLLARGRFNESGESFLMTRTGEIVTPTRFANPLAGGALPRVPLGGERHDRLAGLTLEPGPSYDGSEVVAAWRPVRDLPLLLVTEQRAEEAFWGTRTARVGVWLGTGSICLLIVGLMAAFALGRRRLARANGALAALNGRLATLNTELAGLNADLERRVAVRTREAVEANQAKSDFLARMSHELRTPLNGVIGLLLLARDRTAEHTVRPLITRAAHAARGLLDIIGEVLDFSKIEARRLVLSNTDFALAEVIDALQVLPASQPHADAVALRIEVAEGVPTALRGDPLRLRQVLFNLVGNAYKFTTEGEVRLRIERLDLPDAESSGERALRLDAPGLDGSGPRTAHLRFSVTDTGAGFDPAHLDRLFEPFAQADESVARLYGGTGLGLAISRAFVEAMGGVLQADGQPGAGARFWFDARFGLALQRPPRLSGTQPPVSLPPLHLEPAVDLSPPVGPSRGRVLVVEDDETNRIVAHGLIARLGYTPHLAADGPAGIAAAAAQRFDLVFVDIRMPGMDGYAVVRALRARHGAALPILMLTADVQPDALARATEAGADGHVSKPIDPSDLAMALARHLDSGPARLQTPVPAEGAAPQRLEASLAALTHLDAADVHRRLAGDQELFAALAAGFIRHHAQVAATAQLAWTADDHETALRMLHTLKGVAGNLGARTLATRSSEAEDQARTGQRPDFEGISNTVAAVVAELRLWLRLNGQA
jgi:signal transduction histidine kinase/CheY-like chemotaxis protein/HPt (histidine-containing phosphotransfer) domain-containing protein